ncbi:hypothetical protein DFQ27_001796, partial [Actinomortierella ambigua]
VIQSQTSQNTPGDLGIISVAPCTYEPWGASEPYETFDYDDDGDMDQTCQFCGAKYWLK